MCVGERMGIFCYFFLLIVGIRLSDIVGLREERIFVWGFWMYKLE